MYCAAPRCMSALHVRVVQVVQVRVRSSCAKPCTVQVRVRASCVRGWLSPPRKSACERLAYAGGSLPAPPRCLLPARALPPQCLQPARQTKRCFIATPQSAACSDGLSSLTTTPPHHPTISRPAALHDRALHAAMHERLNLLMRSASGSPPSPHPSQCLQPARQTKKRCFIDASRRAMHRRPSLHSLPKTNDSGSNALGPLPLTDFPVLASPPPPPFPPYTACSGRRVGVVSIILFQVGRTFGRYSRSIVYGTSTLHALRLRPPTVIAPDASQWACASLSSHVWCL